LRGRDILLIIDSPGGSVEPAYLISKTLKRLGKKFSVAVPRRAKSAATLLSLGADEIHMGMMSQLGPIDPQVSGLPALALGNDLKHIAEIAEKCPGASEVLAKYLIDQVPIRRLGYYERVSESAVQYAERLLTGKVLPDSKSAEEVAKHLVHHYKDHSFVIDIEEAQRLLGATLVKEQTPEYELADEIYSFLDFAMLVGRINKKQFWVVGAVDGISWRDIQD
jgi:membrane-bound ClpP family serine protease